MKFESRHILIYNNYIHVDGFGRVGLYSPIDKVILLDYSMKWIVGTNEKIKADSLSEVKEKILQLFKK